MIASPILGAAMSERDLGIIEQVSGRGANRPGRGSMEVTHVASQEYPSVLG